MYIGEKKIQSTFEQDNGKKLRVSFEDDSQEIVLTKSLFDNLVSKTKGQGGVTDNINHYFATKFLYELSAEEFEYYMVDNIAVAMRTLAHNMREDLIRETFQCSGGDAINLKLLVENIYGDKKQEADTKKKGTKQGKKKK